MAAIMYLAAWPLGGSAAVAAGSKGPSKPAAARSAPATTLPALPTVPLSVTDGQPAQKLFADAVALVSVGVDASAVQAAIDATQRKLVQDAVTAQNMSREAGRADVRVSDALALAASANAGYHSLDGAVKRAVVFLYTNGPKALTVNPAAGDKLAYAADYAATAISPTGILATRGYQAQTERRALAAAARAQTEANRAASQAAAALAAGQAENQRLYAELSAIAGASTAEVVADHASLAAQAGNMLLSAAALQFTPPIAIPKPLSTTSVALAWAFSELGKPYVWAATGPGTFDCSGLTQYVWRQAGVSIPRVAADQDAWTIPVPLSQLLPGDLVFFGLANIHHVGIYIGGGLMINAPHTGDVVRVSPIWWSDLTGFGRVHAPSAPVPLHQPPSVQQPAPPVVVPTAGPVPSQIKPPVGWKPKSAKPHATTTSSTRVPTPSTTTTTLPQVTTTTVPATTTVPPTSTTTSSIP